MERESKWRVKMRIDLEKGYNNPLLWLKSFMLKRHLKWNEGSNSKSSQSLDLA
jgi:hypothetical protein